MASSKKALALAVSIERSSPLLVGYSLFAGAKMSMRMTKVMQLLEQLRTQVHSRKYKNIDILSLSQEVYNIMVAVTKSHIWLFSL